MDNIQNETISFKIAKNILPQIINTDNPVEIVKHIKSIWFEPIKMVEFDQDEYRTHTLNELRRKPESSIPFTRTSSK